MFGELLAKSGGPINWWVLLVILLLLVLGRIRRAARPQTRPAVAVHHYSAGFGCAVGLAVGLVFAVLGGYLFWPMYGLQQHTVFGWLLKVLASLVAGLLTGGWIVLVTHMKNRAGR